MDKILKPFEFFFPEDWWSDGEIKIDNEMTDIEALEQILKTIKEEDK